MRFATLPSVLLLASALAGCADDVVTSHDGPSPPDGGDAGTVQPDACPATTIVCGAGCVDTSTDPLHCGSCDHACSATETCAASQCVAAGPTLVQDNFTTQPGGTRAFQAVVRFSEPVLGVDTTSVQVDGGARIDAVQTTDQQSYTFAVDLLRNATTFTISFGSAIHDSHGASLVPVTYCEV